MKNINKGSSLLAFILIILFANACTTNNLENDNLEEDLIKNDITATVLEQKEKESLLFMLEEEKLARDTYAYLNNLWSINQFANIKKSEQSHMDAISTLLTNDHVEHTILAPGVFANKDLQDLYNQFTIDGAKSISNALQIGATIEDLDIVDLKKYSSQTTNTAIIAVFNKLECGSRNHLRSFLKAITNNSDTYTPQFLTLEEYNSIVSSSQEKCN
ncbi:DUF2202 domain-containing protein [Bacteroidota bacterium]